MRGDLQEISADLYLPELSESSTDHHPACESRVSSCCCWHCYAPVENQVQSRIRSTSLRSTTKRSSAIHPQKMIHNSLWRRQHFIFTWQSFPSLHRRTAPTKRSAIPGKYWKLRTSTCTAVLKTFP